MQSLDQNINAVCDEVRRTSLKDLNSVQLMRRFDSKFVVPESWIPELVIALEPSTHILEVDGQCFSDYENVYYETPDDLFLTDHLRGKARRMKIRTRKYSTNGLMFLEVKQRFPGGKTMKNRIDRGQSQGLVMSEEEMRFLQSHSDVAAALEPRIQGDFSRFTLVDFDRKERITVDRNLSSNLMGQEEHSLLKGMAVIEIKQPRPDRYGPAQMWLRTRRNRKGVVGRKTRISKYTMARLTCDKNIAGRTYLATHRRLQEACSWTKDLQAQSRP